MSPIWWKLSSDVPLYPHPKCVCVFLKIKGSATMIPVQRWINQNSIELLTDIRNCSTEFYSSSVSKNNFSHRDHGVRRSLTSQSDTFFTFCGKIHGFFQNMCLQLQMVREDTICFVLFWFALIFYYYYYILMRVRKKEYELRQEEVKGGERATRLHCMKKKIYFQFKEKNILKKKRYQVEL